LAATALAGASALAADLPLKASPKAADFNPFWTEAAHNHRIEFGED
jgi:hypothetical protein